MAIRFPANTACTRVRIATGLTALAMTEEVRKARADYRFPLSLRASEGGVAIRSPSVRAAFAMTDKNYTAATNRRKAALPAASRL